MIFMITLVLTINPLLIVNSCFSRLVYRSVVVYSVFINFLISLIRLYNSSVIVRAVLTNLHQCIIPGALQAVFYINWVFYVHVCMSFFPAHLLLQRNFPAGLIKLILILLSVMAVMISFT